MNKARHSRKPYIKWICTLEKVKMWRNFLARLAGFWFQWGMSPSCVHKSCCIHGFAHDHFIDERFLLLYECLCFWSFKFHLRSQFPQTLPCINQGKQALQTQKWFGDINKYNRSIIQLWASTWPWVKSHTDPLKELSSTATASSQNPHKSAPHSLLGAVWW